MPKVGKKTSTSRFKPYTETGQIHAAIVEAQKLQQFSRSNRSGRRNAATEDQIRAMIAIVEKQAAAVSGLPTEMALLKCTDDISIPDKKKTKAASTEDDS